MSQPGRGTASSIDHLTEWVHLALEHEEGVDRWRDYQRGNLIEAEAYWKAALNIFNSLGVVYDKVGLLNNLGGLAFGQGNYDIALGYYEECLALAHDLGDKRGIVEALTNLGVTLTHTHRWSAAADCYHEALQIDSGDRYQIRLRRSLARIHLLEAIEWLRKANLGEVRWSLASRQFLSGVSQASICLFQAILKWMISSVGSIAKSFVNYRQLRPPARDIPNGPNRFSNSRRTAQMDNERS